MSASSIACSQSPSLTDRILDDLVENRFGGLRESIDAETSLAILEKRLETIRRGEVDRVRRRLKPSPELEDAIESLSRSIVTEIMRAPVTVLKAAATDPHSAGFVDSAHRLLSLEGDRG